MIPLRDANPSHSVPFVNYALITANVLIFLFEVSLGRAAENFIFRFGIIPARLIYDFDTSQVGLATFIPLFSSMFLHGGWMHLIGNMLFLWIFGDNVEDRFGHMKYFVFYIVAGIAAALTQVYMFPSSEMPMVGASGAIAGVLGAYIFMFPTARILTLIPIFFFFQVVELPAFLFLGIWFLMQALSGFFALGIGSDAGGIAWWAHIGGFLVGAVLLPFLRKPRYR